MVPQTMINTPPQKIKAFITIIPILLLDASWLTT
jgi:hypothetical protein